MAVFSRLFSRRAAPEQDRVTNLRLGMWLLPLHPPERPVWSTIEENTEKSLLADDLGFDELWVGEHFSATSEPIPSPLMFCASLIPRTTRIAFGTAVINLPNHHPAKVAVETAQFDHMSKGRFMMGIGPGGLVSDFELFNVPDQTARQRMVIEAMDFIQRIWTQDPPYDLKGEFWTVNITRGIVPELGIGSFIKPFQKPSPPIFVSVATQNSTTARTAAEKGWGMLSANTVPAAYVASHWAAYSETCRAAGRPASGDCWRVARNILVAPTDAEAQDRGFAADGANRWFFEYLHTAQRALSVPTMPVDIMIQEYALCGSPATMLDKLVAFRDAVGPFGTLLVTGLDWAGRNADWERQSMQLLAQEVMPRFRQHVLGQPAPRNGPVL